MSPATRAILAGFAQTGLFGSVLEEALLPLAQATQLKQVPVGQVIIARGKPNQVAVLVISGWVKLSRETLDGAEAVIDVVGPGHFIGLETAVVHSAFESTATVVEEAEVLLMPADLLRQLAEANPALYAAIFKHQLNTQNKMTMELESRSLKSAPQRVGCLLLSLCQPGHKGATTLHLPYDKSLPAARLGMQPETFSRALATLKKELGLNISASSITLSKQEDLVAFTCSACSGAYPCNSKIA